MTKVLNLDNFQLKREKVIILNGNEHVMKTLTVKEYIFHMKQAETLAKLEESVDSLGAGLDATINILLNAFPTVKREEFEALNMDQLDALRGLVDESNDDDLEAPEDTGETQGETA